MASTVQVDQRITDTVAAFGRLDGVFNNAGIGGLSPADAYTDEDFLRIIDITGANLLVDGGFTAGKS